MVSEFSSVSGAWQGSAGEGCYCHFIIVLAVVPHPQSVWTHRESVSCDSWDAGESPGGQAWFLPCPCHQAFCVTLGTSGVLRAFPRDLEAELMT